MTRYHGTLLRAEEELNALDSEAVERATEQWDARVLSTLGHADLRELTALTEAIQRIDDGLYGKCAECGAGIAARRLQALPAARTCVACAFAAESHAAT